MFSTTVRVSKIRASANPVISETEFENQDEKILFHLELPNEAILFSKKDELQLQLSSKDPGLKKDLQLKVCGKVVRKIIDEECTLRISFYGLQSWLKVPKTTKINFAAMDDIYLLLIK